MKKLVAGLVTGFFLCGVAGMAQAILINVDWQSTDDELLIRDTTTNLEWLNLTQTQNIPVDDVLNQLNSGGSFEGFRYATNDEVVNLFNTYFGIDLVWYARSTEYPHEHAGYLDPGIRLASETLGDGISLGTDSFSGPNANYHLLGFTSELMLDGREFILGGATRWSDTDYYGPIDFQIRPDYYPINFRWVGSYLVQDVASVPEPSTIIMLGSGLAILVGIRRKKKI